MLICNSSDTLVNRLRGVVKKLDTDSIEVKFLINENPFLLVFQERFLQHLTQLKKLLLQRESNFP
jgi:hypothetical protein